MSVNRREFIGGLAALLSMACTGRSAPAGEWYAPRWATNPFTLGVASGEPAPDGFVLWTRLAPDPLNGGGMPAESVKVAWEVAEDPQLKRIVKRGTDLASADMAHSVHIEVSGLKSDRPYWYRFSVGDAVSPIARTRTAPLPNATVSQLKLAFASCQHYDFYFTAHRDLAQQNPDLVFHLGDYIYENGPSKFDPSRPRQHNSEEIMSLADYRNRYALYKLDADLQAAHHAAPWLVTWDDHEVDNNYAGAISEKKGVAPADFLLRRAAAYKAAYEHQPLRRSALPKGPDMPLYRALQWGNLAAFNILDTRQYRTDQPCGDGLQSPCEGAFDPAATLTGAAQEQWLTDNLRRSPARWNVIPQQVMMAPVDYVPGPGERLSMDMWSGYVVQRNRLLQFLSDAKIRNPVVLTGDIHSNWVADLKLDFAKPDSPIIGTEFIGTSITSSGDGSDTRPEAEKLRAENPHIRFYNNQRGYVLCTVTPQRWQADYRVVARVTVPDAAVTTRASFIVADGKPGAQPA